jgi:hypothetical protein
MGEDASMTEADLLAELLECKATVARLDAENGVLRCQLEARARHVADLSAAILGVAPVGVPQAHLQAEPGPRVVLWNEFDARLVRLRTGACPGVLYEPNGGELLLQTPRLEAPFGVGRTGRSASLALCISRGDAAFVSQLQALDTHLRALHPHAKYMPSVRSCATCPLWRITVPASSDGTLTCDVYNGRGEDVRRDIATVEALARVTAHAAVTAIVRCGGPWFVDGSPCDTTGHAPARYGLAWVAVQLRIEPPPQLTNYAFVDD